MINTVFFGINIIIGIIIWKFVLKPSLLDHFRDKLFDLREDVRAHYISRSIPLTSSTYRNMRDLLNSHIRFTEEINFTAVACSSIKLEKNGHLKKYLEDKIEGKFKTNDKHLSNFIGGVRKKSSAILLNYMILSSPGLVFLFSMILICYVPFWFFKKVFSSIKGDWGYMLFALTKTSKIVSNVASPINLEKLSFESSMGK